MDAMFRAAIAAADPALVVPPHLPPPPKGRTIVVGAGKAAASMAKAVEDHWPSSSIDRALEGLVVTRYGHGLSPGLACSRIEVVEAAHPVPDAAGRAAAQRILDKVGGLSADDLVICLISGGGSALLALPAEGLTLEDKQGINSALLKSGAPIGEMNTVRKHLSAIKGGRLAAAAWPARIVTLIISDVPGDDPAVVASGPTVADPTTSAEALAILRRYRIAMSPAITRMLEAGENETPKPGDPRLAHAQTIMIATPQKSLDAAAEVARKAGLFPISLGDAIEGEAREVAREHAALALRVAEDRQNYKHPCVLLSGGETTVTVRGKGRGGRNVEYLLSLTIALKGHAAIHALAGDTDGIDGVEDSAGAVVRPDTLSRAAVLGLDPQAYLEANDAWSFFSALGDLVVTGPTLTNVNDFRCLIIE
jgi:glycerate 2-kinase